MTIFAVIKLIPRPPAFVESIKMNLSLWSDNTLFTKLLNYYSKLVINYLLWVIIYDRYILWIRFSSESLPVRFVVSGDSVGSVWVVGVSIKTAVLVAFPQTVILQNIQNSRHLRKYQNPYHVYQKQITES